MSFNYNFLEDDKITFLNNSKKYINYCIKKYKNVFEDYEDLEHEAICVALRYGKKNNYDINLVKERLLLGVYWESTKYLLRNLDRFTDFTEKYCLCMRIYENCKKNIKHEPDYKDLSYFVGITKAQAYEVLHFVKNYENYNTDLVFDREEVKEDYNLEDEVTKYVDTKIFEEVFLPKLTDKQRQAIEMRYGFCGKTPLSGLSIARTLGTTRQNVSLLEQNAKEKLKSLKKLRKFYKD